jgi:hypothetical protein
MFYIPLTWRDVLRLIWYAFTHAPDDFKETP